MLQAIAPVMGLTVPELILEEHVSFPSGGEAALFNHPESDNVLLKIENLTIDEVLSFCRIAETGEAPDGITRTILVEAIRFFLQYASTEKLLAIAEVLAGDAPGNYAENQELSPEG